MRIWHDNTGVGDEASWYCGTITIRDLQEDKTYLFMMDQWLACERGDQEVGLTHSWTSLANTQAHYMLFLDLQGGKCHVIRD